MILGSDSHTRYGALGTMAIGEGGGELSKQLLKQTYDVAYPGVIAIYLTGKPQPFVGPHDIALAICGAVYKNGYVKNKVMEFVGPGVSSMTTDYRNGVDVMTTETTCLSSIWRTDDDTRAFLEKHHRGDEFKELNPEAVAYYDGCVEIDLSTIKPMIALPFHPLLNLIHYNTSAGVTGSLLEYQWIIYLYVLTSCTQNVCSQFIRALGHVRLYAIDGIFRTFVTIMLNILYLKVFRWNILGYVFSIICSDALSTVCLFIIAGLWKYVKLKRLDTHLWRGMLAYSLPLVPDAILVYIIGFSDQVFLASMQDTAVSAIYSIAYRVPTLIALVASIFVDAWQISMVNNNTKEEQITFFSNVGNTYSSIVFIIASGGVMCAKLAMTVLAVPSYYIGWTFIPILAVGAGFNCLSSFQKSVYLLEKKTVASFLSTAFSAVINIGLNALLIPRMGGTGAALATLISYVALFLYRAIDSRRFMPVRWKVPRLTLTVILLAVQSVLMLLEPPLWLVWQIALFGAVAALNSREMLLSVKKLLHRA